MDETPAVGLCSKVIFDLTNGLEDDGYQQLAAFYFLV